MIHTIDSGNAKLCRRIRTENHFLSMDRYQIIIKFMAGLFKLHFVLVKDLML